MDTLVPKKLPAGIELGFAVWTNTSARLSWSRRVPNMVLMERFVVLATLEHTHPPPSLKYQLRQTKRKMKLFSTVHSLGI